MILLEKLMNTAMIKATITDSEKRDEIMSVRMPELEYMNLQHEFYSMQLMEDWVFKRFNENVGGECR